MPGTPLRLGPFVGGLNTQADPTAIGDAELVECVNFELDLDGSLISRPPIQTTTDMSGTWTERIVLLGVGVFSGSNYLFGSNADGIFYFTGGAWTAIVVGVYTNAQSFVQYNDIAYFLLKPNAVDHIVSWSPSGGLSATVSPNLNTMMGADKGGSSLAIFKERLFIVPGPDKVNNTSRLIFSDPGAPQTYSTTTQFVDIHPGDGQKLMDLLVHDDNLMLFKEDSTFVMSYTSSPSAAEVLSINTTIGASAKRCVLSYENSVFLYHEGNVFEIVNYDFQRINTKIPFVYDSSAPSTRDESVFLSLLGDRLVIRYYNNVYVYGLRTRTWGRWQSANTELHNFGPIVGIPSNVVQAINDLYYAGSSIHSNERVFLIKNGFGADVENVAGTPVVISSSITTKNYDLANPYQFKKLYWWGVDVETNTSVTGTVNPIIFGFLPTWSMLTGTWLSYAAVLWGSLLVTPSVSSTVSAVGSGNLRRFIKFPKALRYRQINFQVFLTSSGSTTDSPAKIFSVIAMTATKETLTKALS